MVLSTEAKDELKFWEGLADDTYLPISWPEAKQFLDTDASDNNLGWYFNGTLVSEQADKEEHINVKELRALDRALEDIGEQLSPGPLQWNVDNNTAMWAIKNQGSTKNWTINGLAVDIWCKAQNLGVHIVPRRLSSEENYLADGASRNAEIADWHLDPGVARRIFEVRGVPDIDLMASEQSRQVPRFISWNKKDISAIQLDSLAANVDWSQWQLPYIFPPFPLIARVLEKCKTQKVKEMILVVPWWPSKPYHPILAKMIQKIRRIDMRKKTITNLITGMPVENWKRCALVACRISGVSGTEETSPPLQKSLLEDHGGSERRNSMIPVGRGGFDSVLNMKWSDLNRL